MKAGLSTVLLAALLAAANAAHADQGWRFRVLLDGADIGTHDFRVLERGDDRRVEIDATFVVTFLAVEVYRYTHAAVENWHGGCLGSLEARTDDNGTLLAVHGKASDAGFEVRGPSGPPTLASGCLWTFAYWNPAVLGQKHLLNAQTGEVVNVETERLADETIVVRGTAEPTRRYVLRGAGLRIDLWYAPDGRWVQLESRTSRGQQLKYVLL